MYFVGVVIPDSQLYLIVLPKLRNDITFFLVFDLFRSISINVIGVLFILVNENHFGDIVRFKKIDSIYSLERRRNSR